MNGYWLKSWFSKEGVTLSANFSGKRLPPTTLGVKNYSPWAMTWHRLRDSTFSRFDTIAACDRQTDRQTRRDTQTHGDG